MKEPEDFTIPNEVLDQLNNPEIVNQLFEQGITFQEILGYSDDMMMNFYKIAQNFFIGKDFHRGAEIFTFLTSLNPTVYNYWLGLGMCEQMNGEYYSALIAYEMARLIDEKNPVPDYHTATCYRLLQDKQNALNYLELCLKNSIDKSEYKEIYDSAQKMKSLL